MWRTANHRETFFIKVVVEVTITLTKFFTFANYVHVCTHDTSNFNFMFKSSKRYERLWLAHRTKVQKVIFHLETTSIANKLMTLWTLYWVYDSTAQAHIALAFNGQVHFVHMILNRRYICSELFLSYDLDIFLWC